MALTRYEHLDELTAEELRRDYLEANRQEKLRLLRRLRRQRAFGLRERLPYELAILSVKDPDPQIRRYVAHDGGDLDYRTSHMEGNVQVFDQPERNLFLHLVSDQDELVRAAMYENQHIHCDVELFKRASLIERLAMMRNRNLARNLMERVFDPSDQTLELDLATREKLVLPFFTNTGFFADISKEADFARAEPLDGMDYYARQLSGNRLNEFLGLLWKHASRWSEGHLRVPSLTYQHIPAPDDVMCEVFGRTEDSGLRQTIVQSAHLNGEERVLRLAIDDSDEFVRGYALSRVRRLSEEKLRRVLQRTNKHDLAWLAQNSSLSEEVLKQIKERLVSLEDDLGVSWANQKLGELREQGVRYDETRLFDFEGEGRYDSEKIHVIGRRLIALERWLREVDSEARQFRQALSKIRNSERVMWWIVLIVCGLLITSVFGWLRNMF